MRILITGTTGLVGNNCLRELGDQGHELHTLVRRSHDPRPLEDLEVQRHYADLLQPESLGEAIPAVDAIIHAAGDTHIGRRPRPAQRTVNVDATRVLAEFAAERQTKFIFVSSVDALPAGGPTKIIKETDTGPPKFPCGYVESKRAAEQHVLRLIEAGLDAVIVNPGFLLGPWDWKPSSGRMLLEVATRFTPLGPRGGLSVCHVREVARAICRLVTEGAPRRRYILAGNNLPYLDAWRIFAQVSGSRGPWRRAGWLACRLAAVWGDLQTRRKGKEGDVNSASIGMSELFHYYDSSLAQQHLGYQIPTVEASAGDAWQWFQRYGYVPAPGS